MAIRIEFAHGCANGCGRGRNDCVNRIAYAHVSFRLIALV
jgi:hypothetical protein